MNNIEYSPHKKLILVILLRIEAEKYRLPAEKADRLLKLLKAYQKALYDNETVK